MNSDDLLAILNSVNMGTQFSIELNVNKLLLLVLLIIKPGKKIWKNLYSKSTDSKRYVSNVSNHPTTCLRNIPFCRARHICMIVEYTNIRYMKIKELRTILKIQKYQKLVVQKGIEKALAIPRQQLMSEKLKSKVDILPFISTFNPNNPTVFLKIRKMHGNRQTSKTLVKIFAKHKLLDCEREPSNLKRFLCSSNFYTNQLTFN